MADHWDAHGEYQRTPEEIRDLRIENRHQNERLEKIEERLTEMRVTLVGIDDKNGLRGELREHKEATKAKLAGIEQKVDDIVPAIMKGIAGIIAALSGVAAIIWTILEVM